MEVGLYVREVLPVNCHREEASSVDREVAEERVTWVQSRRPETVLYITRHLVGTEMVYFSHPNHQRYKRDGR